MKTEKKDEFEKGFILWKAGKRIEIARLRDASNGAFDGKNPLIRIDDIPDSELQTDYTHGEGPGLIYQDQIINKITPDEAFNYLRAELLLERMERKLSKHIKGFVILEENIIFVVPFLSSQTRNCICAQIIGVYPRDNVWFCAGDEIPENITEIQLALLKKTLPDEYEMVRGGAMRYSCQYTVV